MYLEVLCTSTLPLPKICVNFFLTMPVSGFSAHRMEEMKRGVENERQALKVEAEQMRAKMDFQVRPLSCIMPFLQWVHVNIRNVCLGCAYQLW